MSTYMVRRVPPKVAFFLWEAIQGKVLILDDVQRGGIHLLDGCYLCLEIGETVNCHLLNCRKTGLYGTFY